MSLYRALAGLTVVFACSYAGEPDYDLLVRGRAWTGGPDGDCRASAGDWDWP